MSAQIQQTIQSRKQSSDQKIDEQFCQKLENLLLKSLKSCQAVLDQETLTTLQSTFEHEIGHNPNSLIECLQHLLYTLIGNLQNLQQAMTINLQKDDYENLEGSIQKAQAQIRKHIRLEQQLKIYMDGLEEKVQQLQKELKIQSNKYLQLFQAMKTIDMQKRQLQKKLAKKLSEQQHERQKDKYLSHKTSKILSQPSIYDNQTHHKNYDYSYKMYNERNRITKSKNFLQNSLSLKQRDHAQYIIKQKQLNREKRQLKERQKQFKTKERQKMRDREQPGPKNRIEQQLLDIKINVSLGQSPKNKKSLQVQQKPYANIYRQKSKSQSQSHQKQLSKQKEKLDNSQIKQMTRTIQLKHQAYNYRKNSRKLLKYQNPNNSSENANTTHSIVASHSNSENKNKFKKQGSVNSNKKLENGRSNSVCQ